MSVVHQATIFWYLTSNIGRHRSEHPHSRPSKCQGLILKTLASPCVRIVVYRKWHVVLFANVVKVPILSIVVFVSFFEVFFLFVDVFGLGMILLSPIFLRNTFLLLVLLPPCYLALSLNSQGWWAVSKLPAATSSVTVGTGLLSPFCVHSADIHAVHVRFCLSCSQDSII